ncbi:MAG: tripartite tricarboxylate transporter permease, partial [Planctomycetota bacterium]|nr:tripartite tricarboxylate transporter permease [Planctomycetota bacterium]
GISPATGQARLTFGFPEMNDGFELLPVLIGLFAINQMFQEVGQSQPESKAEVPTKGIRISLRDVAGHGMNMFRSSVIGTWIGMLPGIGANIGSITSYSVAKSCSNQPDKFGQGSEEGIVAAEAANNATIGGGLIPLVAMGLPGSVVEAVLLGALVLHGFQPGPRLFDQSPQLVYSIVFSCLAATMAMGVLMSCSMRWLARLAKIPRGLLFPLIVVFCVVGAYAISNRWFDVWIMLGFGAAGYALEIRNIPLAPLVIGFVLGPIAEENLAAGLMSTNGNPWPIVTEPKSLIFIAIAILLLLIPVLKQWNKGRWDSSKGKS